MDKKKLAAALAAVMAHIKTSEAAMAQAALQAAEPETQAPVQALPQAEARPYNTWGITGRQNLMQANSMMQMRMFK